MTRTPWRDLDTALAPCAARPIRFWLRDDDAVAVTPALQRLDALITAAEAPLLLAVIPAGATPALGAWTAARPLLTPCQHGYAHANHATARARACELGGERDDEAVLRDLGAGRAAMDAVFGAAWARILVPPWNRIRPSLLPHLVAAGYAGLSAFAGAPPAPLPVLHCDLDIIDWRNGRRGRSAEDVCGRLVQLIAVARTTGVPVGILTHHVAHDEGAWHLLDGLMPLLRDHPGAAFVGADQLLRAPAA